MNVIWTSSIFIYINIIHGYMAVHGHMAARRPDINNINIAVYLFILVVVVFFFFLKCQICCPSQVVLVTFDFLGSKYHVFKYYGCECLQLEE